MIQKSGQLTLLTKGDTNLVGILFANNQPNVHANDEPNVIKSSNDAEHDGNDGRTKPT